MKDYKMTPTSNRQGTLVDLVDKIHAVVELSNNIPIESTFDNETTFFEQEHVEKIIEKLRNIREFDITTIGNLYLTTGDRVVLDRGYGEYFTKCDKTLFTLDELKQGIPYKIFKDKINSSKD